MSSTSDPSHPLAASRPIGESADAVGGGAALVAGGFLVGRLDGLFDPQRRIAIAVEDDEDNMDFEFFDGDEDDDEALDDEDDDFFDDDDEDEDFFDDDEEEDDLLPGDDEEEDL